MVVALAEAAQFFSRKIQTASQNAGILSFLSPCVLPLVPAFSQHFHVVLPPTPQIRAGLVNECRGQLAPCASALGARGSILGGEPTIRRV